MIYFVFDVESIGLHGEGFAVGFVVVSETGEVLSERRIACDPNEANGLLENFEWVKTNVPAMTYCCKSPREVRNTFWGYWLEWRKAGAALVADCAWPVEARFLAACVDDAADGGREWEGPYPLHDLASVMLAHGRDPLATNERLPEELPAHDPLNDARQSARLLLAALERT